MLKYESAIEEQLGRRNLPRKSNGMSMGFSLAGSSYILVSQQVGAGRYQGSAANTDSWCCLITSCFRFLITTTLPPFLPGNTD